MRRLLILLVSFVVALGANAQSDRQHIRNGNRLYHEQKFEQAEVEYRKALGKNSANPQAHYNLGCALMAQQKDSAAIKQYETAGKMEKTPKRRAMVYHNIGVVCQQHQLYQQAIAAYEESLRNNPNDNETRYNLALCKRLLKNNPQNNQKKNNKDKDKKNNKDQNNKDQNQKNQDKQNQDKQQEQMSKDNAEQLLNAAMQQEQATQQRLKNAMRQPQRRKLQKNW
ncbi:MAG: tetratricopeptide repeat protein [Bacteroidales bacterium]|nr:tetratricopeptide repeat protein [Bacteroidales bacterium]MCI7653710.1 tetratricopeptide repeat protein [Bacteroidales bacterium]MDD7705333.1 tetratricopeptide repeat protein [Bacteroidales bacterium]